MDLKLTAILFGTTVLGWWLSGYDANVTGENKAADLKRRTIRTGIGALLVAAGVGGLLGGSSYGAFVFIGMAVPLAILWTGCLSELLARAAHSLIIDSEDSTPYDPGKLPRDLDTLAEMVQQGRNEEALGLCTTLVQSHESSALAMDAILSRVYDQMFSHELLLNSPPSLESRRLFQEGRATEAESRLGQWVRSEPRNLRAIFCYLRFYGHDLRHPEKAKEFLDTLHRRSDLPPGFLDYLRQRMEDWLSPASRQEKGSEGIESLLVQKARPSKHVPEESVQSVSSSVSDLLTAGHLGTAIEILENDLAQRPQDFDLWLRLAEAYGVYCCNIERASKIVDKMEASAWFTSQQLQTAQTKLNEWRARSVKIGSR